MNLFASVRSGAAALLLSAVAAPFAGAQSSDLMVLNGTVRDFKASHPDFEWGYGSGLVTGMVKNQLDAEGKPVLNDSSTAAATGLLSTQANFAQWFRDTKGVNKTVPFAITLEPKAGATGVYYYAREKQSSGANQYFFPLDGRSNSECWADEQVTGVGTHNYYFTYELATLFEYTARANRADPSQDLVFRFVGDDDVWVFVNGHLVVDLGGIHVQESGSVNLDDLAATLGLVEGSTYELKVFFAERRITESNFRIETTLQLTTETAPLYD